MNHASLPTTPVGLNGRRDPAAGLVVSLAKYFLFFVAISLFLNTLYFALRTANPVMRSDAWYFVDVFLSKAINGSLQFSDFFVKRISLDHAQPLNKLALLLEWRYFGLDFVVEAVIGVLAAAGCAVVFRYLAIRESRMNAGYVRRALAWVAICALLFSLNAQDTWTWPLAAFGYVNSLIVLLYMVGVWRAWVHGRWVLLAVSTLILGIVADDSAVIAVIATLLALVLVRFRDAVEERRPVWKTIAVIVVCMVVVRIGYSFAPVVGGSLTPAYMSQPGTLIQTLFERFVHGGWWKWWAVPFLLPVFDKGVFDPALTWPWWAADAVVLAFLMVAHLWFWYRAFTTKHDSMSFVAVALMLLAYAWIAGIIVGRVTLYGNDYLYQPRYVSSYLWHLIALLLMWAAAIRSPVRPYHWRRALAAAVPVIGCLFVLAVQIPLSINAWHVRKYQLIYDINMAHQIDALAKDPVHATDCVPELPVCQWPLEKRAQLAQMLAQHRLNVFSPQVQRRHHYLPKLAPIPGPVSPKLSHGDGADGT